MRAKPRDVDRRVSGIGGAAVTAASDQLRDSRGFARMARSYRADQVAKCW